MSETSPSDGSPANDFPEIPGYTLRRILGQGGMGLVYQADQHWPPRTVALKMVRAAEFAPSTDLKRFKTEIEIVARLHHANIVQIYEAGSVRGQPFFTMEVVDGGSLTRRIAAGPLPPEQAARWLMMLAGAIQHAHDNGIVHRDLKPDNVLLTPDGIPKLTDFGVAKCLDNFTGARSATQPGKIIGTLTHMSPEQAAGRTDVGRSTDVYGLGAILYEMLSGHAPFTGESEVEIMRKVREDDPAPLTNVPRDLNTLCLACLRKEPDKRCPSAKELADELERYLAGVPLKTRPMGKAERTLRWLQRQPIRTGALAVATAALLAALVLWWLERPPSDARLAATSAAMRGSLFDAIASSRGEDGWFENSLQPKIREPGQCWPHSQALAALFATPDVSEHQLRTFQPGVELLFTPGCQVQADDFHYGWKIENAKSYTQAEPALWIAVALADILKRDDARSPDERQRYLAWLDDTHAILRSFQSTTAGGWNMLARQDDPAHFSPYSTAMCLLALLETLDADLPWDGDKGRRDEFLRDTVQLLVDRFDADSHPPGWRGGDANPAVDSIKDGLTLQIYAQLLHAEDGAGISLPPAILEQIPRHLKSCIDRNMDYPLQSCSYELGITNYQGMRTTAQETVRFTWYPWAIECATRWLLRARHHDVKSSDEADVRLALKHLLVDLGPSAVDKFKQGATFEAAETLYCLAAVHLLAESKR
jgi:serine/threonine protein kinase